MDQKAQENSCKFSWLERSISSHAGGGSGETARQATGLQPQIATMPTCDRQRRLLLPCRVSSQLLSPLWSNGIVYLFSSQIPCFQICGFPGALGSCHTKKLAESELLLGSGNRWAGEDDPRLAFRNILNKPRHRASGKLIFSCWMSSIRRRINVCVRVLGVCSFCFCHPIL